MIDRVPGMPACWLWPLPGPELDGIDPVDAMAEWQDDRCAVCGRRLRTRNSVLDHDHETALIRGWLCRGCNVKEGNSGTAQMERYRLINPATIFGVEERYVDSWGREAVPRAEDPLWNMPASAFVSASELAAVALLEAAVDSVGGR